MFLLPEFGFSQRDLSGNFKNTVSPSSMNIMEIEKQLLLEQHGSSEVEVDHYVEAEHHASRWPLHVLQIHTKRSSWFRNGWPFTIIIISLVFTAGLIIGIAVAPVNHPPHSISFCKFGLCPLHLKHRSSRSYRKTAPAQSAVRYEQQSTHPTDHHLYSSYSGPPTDQQTKAWERLLERSCACFTLLLLD